MPARANATDEQLLNIMTGPQDWASKLQFDRLEQAHGLPKGFLSAVMREESNGDPEATSPKGAAGIFQFMPDTAASYKIDPYNPRQAAPAAAKELASLYRKYGGDTQKTLAAWNWGQGNLDDNGIEKAPKETRSFVSRVMGWLSPSSAEAATQPKAVSGPSDDDLLKIMVGDQGKASVTAQASPSSNAAPQPPTATSTPEQDAAYRAPAQRQNGSVSQSPSPSQPASAAPQPIVGSDADYQELGQLRQILWHAQQAGDDAGVKAAQDEILAVQQKLGMPQGATTQAGSAQPPAPQPSSDMTITIEKPSTPQTPASSQEPAGIDAALNKALPSPTAPAPATRQLDPRTMDDDELIRRAGMDPAVVKKSQYYTPDMFKNALITPESWGESLMRTPFGSVMNAFQGANEAGKQIIRRGLYATGLMKPEDLALFDAMSAMKRAEYHQYEHPGFDVPILGHVDPVEVYATGKIPGLDRVHNIIPVNQGAGVVTRAAQTAANSALATGAANTAIAPVEHPGVAGSENDSFWGQKLGQFIGGAALGGTIGAATGPIPEAVAKGAMELPGKVVGAIGRTFNQEGSLESYVGKAVAAKIQETVPDWEARWQLYQDIKAQHPDFNPTLGQIFQSDDLMKTEQTLSGQSSAAHTIQTEKRTQTQRALGEGADAAVADATQGANLGDTRTALQGQRAAAEEALQKQNDAALYELRQAQKRFDDARIASQVRIQAAQARALEQAQQLREQGMSEGDIRKQVGEDLRRIVQEEKQKAWQASSKEYKAVDPDNTVEGPIGQTYDDIQQLIATAKENGEVVPPQLTRTAKAMEARTARLKEGEPEFYPTAAQERKMVDSDLELQSFVRRNKGIRPDAGDVSGDLAGVASNKENRTTGLIRKDGLSLDAMAQKAQEAGFIETADTRELIDALRESQRTGRVYSKKNSFVDDVLGEFFANPDGGAAPSATAVNAADVRQTSMSFMELHKLKSQLLRAERETNNPQMAQQLRQAVDKIDRRMTVLAEDSGDTGLMARYRTAQENYKKGYVPFLSGPASEVLQRRNGVLGVANEDVVSRFWHASGQGQVADAEAFTKLLGGRRDAADALSQYAMSDLFRAAVDEKTGILDIGKAEAWQRKNANLLSQFPEVDAKFKTVRDMQQRVEDLKQESLRLDSDHLGDVAMAENAAADVKKQTDAAQKAMDTRVTAQLLGDNYQQKLSDIMSSSKKLERSKQLLEIANAVKDDPQAARGLLAGMWDVYKSKLEKTAPTIDNPGMTIHNPQLLRQYLDEYGHILEQIGGPGFVNNLRTVAQGLEIASRRATNAAGLGLYPKAQHVPAGEKMLRGVPTAAGVVAGYASGHPIAGPAIGIAVNKAMDAWMSIGGAARADLVNNILSDALFNPDAAKTLALMRQPNVKASVIIPRLYMHYLHYLHPTAAVQGSQEEQR